jgi:putative oxidoreductase
MSIFIWSVSALLALEFVVAGGFKLKGVDAERAAQSGLTLSPAFLRFIGAAELAGAAGLLVPSLRIWAAVGLCLVMVGAVVTHARAHHGLAKMAPALGSLGLLVAIVVLAH